MDVAELLFEIGQRFTRFDDFPIEALGVGAVIFPQQLGCRSANGLFGRDAVQIGLKDVHQDVPEVRAFDIDHRRYGIDDSLQGLAALAECGGATETGNAGPATRALVTRIVGAVNVYVGGFSHSTGQENSSTSSDRHCADAGRCPQRNRCVENR